MKSIRYSSRLFQSSVNVEELVLFRELGSTSTATRVNAWLISTLESSLSSGTDVEALTSCGVVLFSCGVVLSTT